MSLNFAHLLARHDMPTSTKYNGYLSFLNSVPAQTIETALRHRSFKNDDFQWIEIKDQATEDNYKLSLKQENPSLWIFIALLGNYKLGVQPQINLEYGDTLTLASNRNQLDIDIYESKFWLFAVGFRQLTFERLAEEFPVLAPLKELASKQVQDWPVGKAKVSARLMSILESLRRLDFLPYSGPIMMATWSLKLLKHILQENKSPVSPKPEQSDIQNYHRAVKYIGTHYTENLTLEKIASAVHLSVRSLTRSFEGRPQTVNGLILHLKLHKARELIMFTELPISDIAYTLQFSCPKYFSRVFKQKFQKSPRNYRLQMKQEQLGFRRPYYQKRP